MTLSAITSKTASALRRSTQRRSTLSVDINADQHGRRRSGDPRVDLAMMERSLRL